jgi:hypothetical protein
MRAFIASFGLETCLLLVFLLLVRIGMKNQSTRWKHVCYNLGAVFLAMAIYELLLTLQAFPKTTTVRDVEYFEADPLLGYRAIGPQPFDVNTLKTFTESGDTIYRVNYGFEEGYRKMSRVDTTNARALFMGGSFVFGEGVNDHETLPSYFEQLTDNILVTNYGFHGYGPHHVLMQLRHHTFLEQPISRKKSGYVYYLFIPEHIGRAHGRSEWDKIGPYFFLDGDSLALGGNFYDKKVKTSRWVNFIQTLLFNSQMYQVYFRQPYEAHSGDLDFILAMITEMNAIVAGQGLEFRVILEYHSRDQETIDVMKEALTARGVHYYDTDDAIANKTLNDPTLYIPGDLHPTSKFHRLLASYLHQQMDKEQQ